MTNRTVPESSPIGHSAIPTTLVGLANGYAAVEDPNYQVGTHTHYRVIQTREHWEDVEVGNFHGYKTYERKKFIGTKIDEFILIDDKLHKDRTHETDTHLLYTYRNRIYGK